jgi:dihydroorotate dehydrogenase
MAGAELTNHLEGPWILADRELPSPFFNAAGLINDTNPREILRMARKLSRTGVGAVQGGSYTIPPSAGNEASYGPPTDYYDPATGEMTNSTGLPNPGRDEVLKIMPEFVDIAHSAGKLAIASVSATKEAQDSVEQTVELVEDFLQTDVDLVIANVSCPNIVEGKDSDARKPIMGYDYETMHRLVETLHSRVGKTGRLGVKPANHHTAKQNIVVPKLAVLYRDYPVFSWMEGPNTIPGNVPRDERGDPILSVPDGAGGLSGPATAANGREQLEMWQGEVGDIMDIVSTQGIHSHQELAWRLRNGAVAGSSVSYLWNSEVDWTIAVDRMNEGVRRIAEGGTDS